MNKVRIRQIAFKVGSIFAVLGAGVFLINWNLFNETIPGYRIALLPGHLFLQLFTEELDFGIKLTLLLIGQFLVSSITAMLILKVYGYFKK
jgi:multisubunit Na+/H+ antiporter MnhG subunit